MLWYLSSTWSKLDSVRRTCPGRNPFYSALRKIFACGAFHGLVFPCQWAQTALRRNCVDRRHAHMVKSWDWCWIAGGEAVAVPFVAALDTRDGGEKCRRFREDAHEVILPSLDRLFGNVAMVIVGRHQLICHARGLNFGFIGFRNLIVQDLVGGYDSLYFHSRQCPLARQYL